MKAPEFTGRTTDEKSGRDATIGELRGLIASWLHIPEEDYDLIDLCLAVFKSNEIPGDPLWAILIDASGGGKTELLRAFRNHKDAYFLSKLSEKTLVSGYRDPKNPSKDPSLLPLLDKKVLVIKDLAPLLSMRQESRNAVIAICGMRTMASPIKAKATLEKWRTNLISHFFPRQPFQSSARIPWIKNWANGLSRFGRAATVAYDKVGKAIRNIGSDDSMRREIESAVLGFLGNLPGVSATTIPPELQEDLAELADFTAKARSTVARDRNGNLQYLPRPEVGTRLGKELGKLLLSLASVRQKARPDRFDFATVLRWQKILCLRIVLPLWSH